MTSEQGAWARPNTETSQPSDSDAEVARPRAERDAGMAPLSASQRRDQRGGFARRAMVAVLVVLFVILLPITITAAWGHRTVLNTDQFTRTITPIATDPAVTAALSREITDQLFVALDPQARVAAALPPKAAFLAAPITNGAKGYVQQAVDRVLNSPQFQTLWIEANKFAHRQLVAVLRGDTKVLDTTNGDVTLNLVPLVTAALTNVQGFASSVVGRQISIPTVTATEVPAESCAKISAALQRPISPTCGQVPLFRAAQLVQAQRAVRAFDRAVVALLIITPLLALVA